MNSDYPVLAQLRDMPADEFILKALAVSAIVAGVFFCMGPAVEFLAWYLAA